MNIIRTPNAQVFFFTNTYRRGSFSSRVDFALGESGLWHWDQETGMRSLAIRASLRQHRRRDAVKWCLLAEDETVF